MQKAQFPFRCPYTVTQGYADNFNHYPEGHHGALDIVPAHPWPTPIYPLYNGSEISIQNTDPVKGKGVRERILLDKDFVAYLKTENCLNGSDWPITDGIFYLDVLYWHMLRVDDRDGWTEINTPIGPAGNTGDVYSGGVAVPDNKKGVSPYPGLHLHLETAIYCTSSVLVGYLNRDKDVAGRIDPNIIFNYPGDYMKLYKDSRTNPATIIAGFQIDTEPNLRWISQQSGLLLPLKADGTVDFEKVTYDGEIK